MQIGKSQIDDGHLKALKDAWANRRLVLFLGAGVSQQYGIMNWNDLVRDLLLDEASHLLDLWPHYQAALATWLAHNFDFSPMTLARVVKIRHGSWSELRTDANPQAAFMDYVAQFLYRNYDSANAQAEVAGPTTLSAIVDLIHESEKEGKAANQGVTAVVTFNFDNILEMKLREKQVDVRSVYDSARRSGDGLPVVHVHGYLPLGEAIPPNELVFTEGDYHKLTYSVFHWALAEIINYLRNYTVLFVGLSMSDPNLRRLIDATSVRDEQMSQTPLVHYLLRKDYKLADEESLEAMQEIQRQAQKEGMRRQVSMVSDEPQLQDAISRTLFEARSCDEDLFSDMGVGTIWVESYEDIPLIIREIAV